MARNLFHALSRSPRSRRLIGGHLEDSWIMSIIRSASSGDHRRARFCSTIAWRTYLVTFAHRLDGPQDVVGSPAPADSGGVDLPGHLLEAVDRPRDGIAPLACSRAAAAIFLPHPRGFRGGVEDDVQTPGRPGATTLLRLDELGSGRHGPRGVDDFRLHGGDQGGDLARRGRRPPPRARGSRRPRPRSFPMLSRLRGEDRGIQAPAGSSVRRRPR